MLNLYFAPSAFIADVSKYDYFAVSAKLMKNKHEDVVDTLMETILLRHGIDINDSYQIINESVSVRDVELDFDTKMENIMIGINSLREL